MAYFDFGPDSPPPVRMTPPPRPRRRLTRRQFIFVGVLCMLLLSGIIGGWTASVFLSRAATPGGLTFQQYQALGRPGYSAQAPLVRPTQAPPVPTSGGPSTDYAHLPPSAEPATMKPLSQALDSTFVAGSAASAGARGLDLVGSDQRLEVQLQAGSLNLTHATVGSSTQAIVVPVGGLTLQVTQLSGHFTGSVDQLGMYQLQVVDSTGKAVSGIALHTPVTIVYHYQPWELQALNLDPNTMKLTWPTLIDAALAAKQSISGLSVALHNDPVAHTLTAQTRVLPNPMSPPCRAILAS